MNRTKQRSILPALLAIIWTTSALAEKPPSVVAPGAKLTKAGDGFAQP